MRKGDMYYCMKCDRNYNTENTYVNEDRFVKCNECHKKLNVIAEDGD